MRLVHYFLAKVIRSRSHKAFSFFKFLVLVFLLLFYPFSFSGVYYLCAEFSTLGLSVLTSNFPVVGIVVIGGLQKRFVHM